MSTVKERKEARDAAFALGFVKPQCVGSKPLSTRALGPVTREPFSTRQAARMRPKFRPTHD